MGEVMHNYTSWVYRKWELCCEEREFYGDECLSLEEFLVEYKDYLHKEYIIEKDKERNASVRIQMRYM